ncbi:hypothetical protein [Campylobacter vulpis]|nr:hypothetical protein [Campylobacter vulpis]
MKVFLRLTHYFLAYMLKKESSNKADKITDKVIQALIKAMS